MAKRWQRRNCLKSFSTSFLSSCSKSLCFSRPSSVQQIVKLSQPNKTDSKFWSNEFSRGAIKVSSEFILFSLSGRFSWRFRKLSKSQYFEAKCGNVINSKRRETRFRTIRKIFFPETIKIESIKQKRQLHLTSTKLKKGVYVESNWLKPTVFSLSLETGDISLGLNEKRFIRGPLNFW